MRAWHVAVVTVVVTLLAFPNLNAPFIAPDRAGSDSTSLFNAYRDSPSAPRTLLPGPQYGWSDPVGFPMGRERHTMIYDSHAGRFIVFGGWDGASGTAPNGYSVGTWSYDLGNDSWVKMRPSDSPTPRSSHSAAYDSRVGKMILFGGANASGVSRETWAYDFESDSWTDLHPLNPPPAGAYGQAMAYDSGFDRIVLCGGLQGYVGGDATGVDAYATNAWTNVTSTQTARPSAGGENALAYDSESHQTLLSRGSASSFISETWAYDAPSNTWTNMRPVSAPSWRHSHALTYDQLADRIILFGGFGQSGINDETWAYDFNHNAWFKMNPVSKPVGRADHSMAFDPRSDRTLLFGGRVGGELWSYDINKDNWTFEGRRRPADLSDHAMVYNSKANRIVLFGGLAHGLVSDETWTYAFDSNEWTPRAPPKRPAPRWGSGMVYDSRADRVILFGGIVMYPSSGGFKTGDTWSYDFANDSWTPLATTGPSPREGPAMAYDSESDRTILFGGDTSAMPYSWDNETWAYDFNTNTWTNMTPGEARRPSVRTGHAMTYDSKTDRIILFGDTSGITNHNDTWTYDFNTNTWTEMKPGVSPPASVGQAMTYDSRLNRVIAHGNRETWAYLFATNMWTNMTAPFRSSATARFAMAYATQSGRIVLFGGMEGVSYSGRTFWGGPVSYASPPRNLIANAGEHWADLNWKAPIDDGGLTVEAYRIYRGPAPGSESLVTA